jgi:hypothetical protein
MGCIIVKKDIMDILDATFSVNEGVIDVVTQYGIAEPLTAAYRTSTSEDSPKS